jgi:hypothetical protein
MDHIKRVTLVGSLRTRFKLFLHGSSAIPPYGRHGEGNSQSGMNDKFTVFYLNQGIKKRWGELSDRVVDLPFSPNYFE